MWQVLSWVTEALRLVGGREKEKETGKRGVPCFRKGPAVAAGASEGSEPLWAWWPVSCLLETRQPCPPRPGQKCHCRSSGSKCQGLECASGAGGCPECPDRAQCEESMEPQAPQGQKLEVAGTGGRLRVRQARGRVKGQRLVRGQLWPGPRVAAASGPMSWEPSHTKAWYLSCCEVPHQSAGRAVAEFWVLSQLPAVADPWGSSEGSAGQVSAS